jgi:hypothetical protein
MKGCWPGLDPVSSPQNNSQTHSTPSPFPAGNSPVRSMKPMARSHVSFEILIAGNFDEKSLALAAILIAT